jgi:hypothetical protein
VGRIYLLENGAGRLLQEGTSLDSLALRAKEPISPKAPFLTRAIVGLAALRFSTEERIEPIFVETEELLTRIAPQVAALV